MGWRRSAGPLLALGIAAQLVSACAPGDADREAAHRTSAQPGYPRLGAALPAGHTTYDNETLADLFVRLTHDLEWGGRRPALVRFEAPVAVGIAGPGAAQYAEFLDRYLGEIRARTGIAIARGPAPHNLAVRFVPGRDFRTKVPRHFCVVAPGALSWETFRRDPDRYGTRAYEVQRRLEAMTVFIPDTAEPYLVRACLIEEIAQALGPANDFYGLGPSIFNDDAAHTWPTRLDYLMLAALYQPEMATGLTRSETRVRARAVLDRLNPAGRAAPPLPRLPERRLGEWIEALAEAFDGDRSDSRRRRAADRALTMAVRDAPGSAYHCHSLVTLARLSRDEPAAELAALERAARICARAHGPDDIRLARIRLEQARATFRAGRAGAAYGLSEGLEGVFAAYGLAERLVALYALQEAALRAIQQGTKSFEARRRAGDWGAYALGRDHADVRRLLER